MKYIVIIIVVTIATSAIINIQDTSTMPVSIGDFKSGSLGVIRNEGGIGDMRITEAARTQHYATEITDKHPNRQSADFPHFGNN
jgi:hypothetical protein